MTFKTGPKYYSAGLARQQDLAISSGTHGMADGGGDVGQVVGRFNRRFGFLAAEHRDQRREYRRGLCRGRVPHNAIHINLVVLPCRRHPRQFKQTR